MISDNGEFETFIMDTFSTNNKIKQQHTCSYTSEHNALIERIFRTLDNICNTMLREKELDVDLWEYAHETAVYLYNRLPRRNTKLEGYKSPEELFYGIKPSLKHVRIFGSKAFVHIPEQTRLKDHLPKAVQGILIWYSEDQILCYKILDKKNNEILISSHVTFDEGDNDFNNPLDEPEESANDQDVEYAEDVNEDQHSESNEGEDPDLPAMKVEDFK